MKELYGRIWTQFFGGFDNFIDEYEYEVYYYTYTLNGKNFTFNNQTQYGKAIGIMMNYEGDLENTSSSYDPYEWAPGVKEQFEKELVKAGYAESVEKIRYEKGWVYNNQGWFIVYSEMDGVELRVVNVNVKTGYYKG